MKRRIGVISPYVDQYYQRDLWQGMQKAATQLGAEVVLYCGSAMLAPNQFDRNNNVIYELIEQSQLDGLVSVTGTLSNYCGSDYTLSYFQKFNNLKTVHISWEKTGHNSVTVDNYQCMGLMLDHLQAHKYRKYAYISGPETNTEALDRKKAFIDFMAQEVNQDKEYVIYYGNFTKESALKVMDIMCEEAYVPDVIVCANDEMAIGVYSALYEKGIFGNQPIAFTGFDDIDNATTFSPSFTTLRQPLFEMGYQSIFNVNHLIEGGHVKEKDEIVGELRIRESCGCMRFKQTNLPHDLDKKLQLKSNTLQGSYDECIGLIEHIIEGNHMRRQLEPHYWTEIPMIKLLLGTLISELKNQVVKGTFLRDFYQFSNRLDDQGLQVWEHFMKRFKERLYQDEVVLPNEMHEILYQMNAIINDARYRHQRRSSYDFMAMYYYVSEMIVGLTEAKNEAAMIDIMIPFVRQYQFEELYICTFDEPITFDDPLRVTYPKKCRLSLGFEEGDILRDIDFFTKDLLPSECRPSEGVRVIYPIVFTKHLYGYIVCHIEVSNKSIFKTIREQVANTLERLSIRKQLEEYNTQLKQLSEQDQLTGVYNLRGLIERVNADYVQKDGNRERLGVMTADLDFLKVINDTFGHLVGDQAIILAAQTLKDCLGKRATVSRVGGDEFVCVVPLEEGECLDQKLLEIQEQIEAINSQGNHSFHMSISIGVAYWEANSKESLESIINQSDTVMYEKKRTGREKVDELR